MLQNSPTSTTPVNILILRRSCTSRQQIRLDATPEREQGRTSAGSRIMVSGNGASMIKLPLSDTTGPAFILPIRRRRPGAPSSMLYGDPRSARLSRTLAYANGVTSIGIPFFHCRSTVSYHPDALATAQ